MAEFITNSAEEDVDAVSIITEILNDIIDTTVAHTHVPPFSPNDQASGGVLSSEILRSTSFKTQQEGDVAGVSPTTKQDVEDSKPTENIPENVPYQTCTVKQILSEILDCTVIRKPSLLSSSTSRRSERNTPETFAPGAEYILDTMLVPSHIISDSNESVASRMQLTVKEVLSEMMDYTVLKKLNQPTSMSNFDYSRPGTSRIRQDHLERRENLRGYEVYTALGAGIVNSRNAIHDEAYIQKPSGLSINRKKMLPSYSSVIKLGPPPKIIKPIHSSSSFIPRQPPPSYAEVEGIWEDRLSLISCKESAVFGPDPTFMMCPRCRVAVITDVEVHRSAVTHIIALFLCLCLCWPCCLLPYCLRSCNYSYHTCPNCSHYFGMYRPF